MPAYSVNSSGPDNAEKFARLSDQFMKDSLALAPSTASQAGYHKHVDRTTGKTIELDAQLDDMSWEFVLKQRAFFQEWRDRFRTETPVASLSPQDAADWHLIDDQIGLVLLDVDKIQSNRHNPLGAVELVGGAIHQTLTANYAPRDVRVGHVLSRLGQVPRFCKQVEECLTDADPIFIRGAIEAIDGNVDLIEHMVRDEVHGSAKLSAEYERVAPPSIAALKDFSKWLQDDFSKRPSSRTWRLGRDLYNEKFHFVMETDLTPEEVPGRCREGSESGACRDAQIG